MCMMKKCQVCLNNMAMLTFKKAIMFESVWWSSKVGNTISGKKGFQLNVFTIIICVKCKDGMLKIFFH